MFHLKQKLKHFMILQILINLILIMFYQILREIIILKNKDYIMLLIFGMK